MKPRLSIAALAAVLVFATAAGADAPPSADFEHGIPHGWKTRGLHSDGAHGSVRTQSEPSGNHFLRISTDGSFYSAGIDSPFDPKRYPILRWRWRVTELPAGANIEKRSGDDAAARLYVVFSDRSLLHPLRRRAIVYVWDSTHPIGSVIANPFAPNDEKAIVIQSGSRLTGEWVSERVNLVSDYRRVFGEDPPTVKAIACASDSDQTHSATSADFDDIRIDPAPDGRAN